MDTRHFGIVAHPVAHSLSPRLYQAAFSALEMDADFSMWDVTPEHLGDFFSRMRSDSIDGVAVSLPHKETCLRFLDEVDAVAGRIGAVNTVRNTHGKLTGYNTDWIGVRDALKAVLDIRGRRVLIVGAGGAGRGVAYTCVDGGARVTVTNRTPEKALALAEDFDVEVAISSALDHEDPFDVIINATSVGLHDELLPVSLDFLVKEGVAMDIVYKADGLTPWLSHATERGLICVPGQEMLLHQAFAQFEILTGKQAPKDAMRQSLSVR